MCGILGFFAKESVPDKEFFDILFTGAEERGEDGTGLVISKPNSEKIYRTKYSYSKDKDNILTFIKENLELGDILLGICRNAPETEELTGSNNYEQTLQPIIYSKEKLALVHNGAITERYVDKYADRMRTKIDSEVLIQSYIKHNRNIKETVEDISGGWSSLLLDKEHNRLYAMSSFIPLAHGYAKGLGLIYHSDINYVRKSLAHWFNRKELRFTRIWEDFYVDELPNYMIESTELDSGLVNSIPYEHKFLHPTYKKTDINKDLYIVLASGGIDSTTSMTLLKHFNKDVLALHFDYNQKSEEAEKIAIERITDTLSLNIPLKTINVSNIYKNTMSMLTNKNIDITTDKNIKSTVAWVPLRNQLFLTIASVIAEEKILSNEYSNVYICGGFPVISEESVYPDNSKRFTDSFKHLLETGSIVGKRIKVTNPTKGFTKAEELAVMKYLGYKSLFGYTVSCDNAIVREGKVYQCWAGDYPKGSPACGSGRLSLWAAKKAGIKDTRNYYKVKNIPEYEPEYIKQNLTTIYDPKKLLQKAQRFIEE